MQILSLGEVLWDVIGAQEYLGGAPLNFSVAAARLGHAVALLTAVGDDARGRRALEAMQHHGIDTSLVQTASSCATGTALVATDASGNARFVIQRPAAFDCIHADASVLQHLAMLQPDWIYFGTLAQTSAESEQTLARLLESLPRARCFYDMNLRAGHWNLPLVQRLSKRAHILKLNEDEAELLSQLTSGARPFVLEVFCREWAAAHGIATICVTLGSKGCAVFTEDCLCTFPGVSVQVADTVGAGDSFAAAFLHALQQGWPLARVAAFANALGALVASRSGATPAWTLEECEQLMATAQASASS